MVSVTIHETRTVRYALCPNCGVWRPMRLHRDGTRTVRCPCLATGGATASVWEIGPDAPISERTETRCRRVI